MEEVGAPLPEDEPCSGRYSKKETLRDAVTLKFDDGNEYYVASDFLGMASPVFRTMLDADFKEKQTGVIELKGKNSDDFLELLEFLHPAVQKGITEETVFRIIPLAEEYDIQTAIRNCKYVLLTIVKEQGDIDKPTKPRKGYVPSGNVRKCHCDAVLKCLNVLHIVNVYSYKDLKALALSTIVRFPSKIYLWKSGVQDNKRYVNNECVEQYSKLHDNVKLAILKQRLDKTDGDDKWNIGIA